MRRNHTVDALEALKARRAASQRAQHLVAEAEAAEASPASSSYAVASAKKRARDAVGRAQSLAGQSLASRLAHDSKTGAVVLSSDDEQGQEEEQEQEGEPEELRVGPEAKFDLLVDDLDDFIAPDDESSSDEGEAEGDEGSISDAEPTKAAPSQRGGVIDSDDDDEVDGAGGGKAGTPARYQTPSKRRRHTGHLPDTAASHLALDLRRETEAERDGGLPGIGLGAMAGLYSTGAITSSWVSLGGTALIDAYARFLVTMALFPALRAFLGRHSWSDDARCWQFARRATEAPIDQLGPTLAELAQAFARPAWRTLVIDAAAEREALLAGASAFYATGASARERDADWQAAGELEVVPEYDWVFLPSRPETATVINVGEQEVPRDAPTECGGDGSFFYKLAVPRASTGSWIDPAAEVPLHTGESEDEDA